MGDVLDPDPIDLADFLFRRPALLDAEKLGVGDGLTVKNRYRQAEKSAFRKWVMGSAWWASALAFFVMLLITTAELVLFDLVLEEQFPTLFPIDAFYLSWLGIVLGFALALYAGTERGLWSDYITNVVGISDDCLTLAWQVTGFVNPNKLHDDVQGAYIYTDAYEVSTNRKRKLYKIMREINIIIRIFPMAVELENTLRKGDKAPGIDEGDWPNNLDNKSILALNLPIELLAELSSYLFPRVQDPLADFPQSAISDQLLHMISLRLNVLLRAPSFDPETKERREVAREFFGPNLFASIDRQIGNIASRSSSLHANRVVSTNPIIKGLLWSSTFLYLFVVPLIPWGAYRWWTLLVAPMFQWALLAFLYAGQKLEIQFVGYNKSNYVHVDTKQIASDGAFAIDRVFDAYYRLGSIEHKATKWSVRTPMLRNNMLLKDMP